MPPTGDGAAADDVPRHAPGWCVPVTAVLAVAAATVLVAVLVLVAVAVWCLITDWVDW